MNSTADRRLKALEFQLFADDDRPIADQVEGFNAENAVGPQDHLVVISFQ
jgi:hypothetical protein